MSFRTMGSLKTRILAFACLSLFAPAASESGKRVPSSGWNQHGYRLDRSGPLSRLGTIACPFVPNRGQAPAHIRFLGRSGAYTLAFLDDGLTAYLDGASGLQEALRFRFLGVQKDVRPGGGRRSSATVNYLLGREPDKWVTGLPAYEAVTYQGLYPGIDLVFGLRAGLLESTYQVSSPGNVSNIKVRCQGARSLALDPGGDLIIRTRSGSIRKSRPEAYQFIDGVRHEVPARFTLDATDQSYGISVHGPWDPRFPLVIDPIYGFGSYLGGSGEDEAYALAIDATGQLYISGFTRSTNFPTQSGLQTSAGGMGDAFVAKISADGQSLIYATYLGGSDRDLAIALAVDASGQVYVTGETNSVDFPLSSGSSSAKKGNADAFLAKLASNGQSLVASRYLGGAGFDAGTGIALDSGGAAYITGQTFSADFPTTNGYQGVLRGVQDAFVTKVESDAVTISYSTYLGGSGLDGAASIAIDSSGQANITGFTDSTNFPTASAYQSTSGGMTDVFVSKVSADGKSLVYSTYLGGSDDDVGNSLVLDSSGDAVITGYTRSTDYPTVAAFQATNKGRADAFMTRLSSSGATVSVSTYLGGSGQDEGAAIARDSRGQVYVAGKTSSNDFPIALGLRLSLGGDSDVFLCQFTPGEQGLQFSTYLGGSSGDAAFALGVDGSGKMYVAGSTQSTDFQTLAPRQATFGGGLSDAFYVRIDPFDPTFVSTLHFPRLVTTEGTGGNANTSEYTGIAVANLSSVTSTVKFSAYDTAGRLIGGSGIANPSLNSLPGSSQLAVVDTQIFGTGLPARKPTGWFKMESTAKETLAFFLLFDSMLSVLDGADVSSQTATNFIFPEVEDLGFTQLHVANPNSSSASLTLELVDSNGSVRATATPARTVAANGVLIESLSSLFPNQTFTGGMYVRGTATRPVVTFEYLGRSGLYVEGLNGVDPAAGGKFVYCPQYVVGGPYRTTLSIVNLETVPTTILLRLISDEGIILGSRIADIAARGKVQISAQNYFVTPSSSSLTQGYVQITSDRATVGGSVVFGDPTRTTFSSALPLVSKAQTSVVFSQVASDSTYFTGVAALNPGERDATFVIDVFDQLGKLAATKTISLPSKRRIAQVLTQIFPGLPSLSSGYFRIRSSEGLLSFALFGNKALTVLSAVPPQAVP